MELATVSLLGLGYLIGLAWSVRQVVRVRTGRFYWAACVIAMLGGTCGVIISALAAPGSTGEMPPQFALSVWTMLLGLMGAVARIVWTKANSALRRPPC
jgi:hypothetical protein